MAKAILRRNYDGMPQGSQVGQEIDVDDSRFAQLERDGFVTKAQAKVGATLTTNDSQKQDRPDTSVKPMGLKNPEDARASASDGDKQQEMKPGDRTANEAILANHGRRGT